MKSEILENDDVTCAGKSHNRTIVISWFGIIIGSLNMHNDLFLSDVRQPEMDVLQSGRDFDQIVLQIVSIRVKTLSNTNFVASRHMLMIFM